MKGGAIVALLIVVALPAAGGVLSQLGAVSSLGNAQVEPGAPGGRAPIDQPVGTQAADTKQGGGAMDQAQLLAQAGAIGILAVVLFFYRRDFFKKNEREREELEEKLRARAEEKELLADLVEKSTTCITNSAVATSRQTDATHRLARTVENLERRQAGLPPTANGSTT